ncbi:MAG TPA: AraC family transcriptional regulator [Gemmatimonadaceae bacterium]
MKRQLVEMNIPQASALGRVSLRSDNPQVVTTQQLDWPGLRLEAGINNIASVDDAVGLHHYVSMNVDDRPVMFEIKGERGPFERFVLRRGTAWVCPAGEPISIRINSSFRYVRMSIDPLYFSRLSSNQTEPRQVELRRSHGIASSQIGHILGAMIAESDAGNPSGLGFVEHLAAGMSHQLSLHAGVRTPGVVRHRGGLSGAARRRALELMHENLNSNMSVQFLAAQVGLSAAHFARAFRESFGLPPHRYVLRLRLERSRHMLDEENRSLADVAQRAGFADQSHFTRFFKREFGVTPGTLVRNRRR